MRASLSLTIIVLAAAGWFGWRAHVRVDAARHRQEVLEKKAAGLAISPDLSGSGPAATTSRNHRRPQVDAKALAAEMLESKTPPDMEKIGRELALLDDRGLETFVAEILSSTRILEEDRGKFAIALMLMALADRPETALAFFDKFSSAGGKTDPRAAAEFVPPALEKWAARDACGALDWIRSHGGKYPEIINEAAKCKVLTIVAASDPRRAFLEIGRLAIAEPQDAVCAIIRAGNTPEQRLSAIAALRGHLAGMADERLKRERSDVAMAELARSAVYGGESAARQWIATAGFSRTEMDAFAAGIARSALRPEEIGSWIDCLAGAGAETFPSQPVQTMVRYWTGQDYQAAGRWLAATTEGPAKDAAIQAYAGTVAKYDPAAAEQWAMTLPAGEDREATLVKIHTDWPADDAAGKSAFARRHGIR
jgi:hypothetical protein